MSGRQPALPHRVGEHRVRSGPWDSSPLAGGPISATRPEPRSVTKHGLAAVLASRTHNSELSLLFSALKIPRLIAMGAGSVASTGVATIVKRVLLTLLLDGRRRASGETGWFSLEGTDLAPLRLCVHADAAEILLDRGNAASAALRVTPQPTSATLPQWKVSVDSGAYVAYRIHVPGRRQHLYASGTDAVQRNACVIGGVHRRTYDST